MVTQLRIYRIKRGKMQEWIREWRERVVPLRERLGYRIDGAWVVDGQNTFVWLVTYDGRQSWADREKEYYASHERTSMKPDPARHIVDTQTWLMTRVSET